MKALTRWNPFREAVRFYPFSDFDEAWKELPMLSTAGFGSEAMLRMDVAEDDNGYVVKADLPGVNKEDIAVSIDGATVSVSAEVKQEKEAKEGGKVLRAERYYGSVTRSFTLPAEIEVAKADAAYEKGVLTLTLPKAAGRETKKLPVH
jgi:HSP20 family protein